MHTYAHTYIHIYTYIHCFIQSTSPVLHRRLMHANGIHNADSKTLSMILLLATSGYSLDTRSFRKQCVSNDINQVK